MIILVLIHLIGTILLMILALVKVQNALNIAYWVLNLLSPTVNAQAIVIYILAGKSRFCQVMAGQISIFSRIGDDTMALNWIILFAHIILPLLLLIAIDCGYVNISFKSLLYKAPVQFNENTLDSDVLAERQRILNLNQSTLTQRHVNTDAAATTQQETDHMVVHDLVKHFPGRNVLAVNHLTFGAKRGEAFGLLGYNVTLLNIPIFNITIPFFSYFIGCRQNNNISRSCR